MASLASETALCLQLANSENLLTAQCYPFPTRLIKINYPRNSRGHPVPPELLVVHSQVYQFNLPRCFHGCTARLSVEHTDWHNITVIFLCGLPADEGESCTFIFNVSKLLQNSTSLELEKYEKRIVSLPSEDSDDESNSMPPLLSRSEYDEEASRPEKPWQVIVDWGGLFQTDDGVNQESQIIAPGLGGTELETSVGLNDKKFTSYKMTGRTLIGKIIEN